MQMIFTRVAVAPVALLLCLSAAHADWIVTGSCVRGGCVFTKRNRIVDPHIIPVPGPRNDLEASEAAERERQWTTRCNPTVFQDRYGVSRYAYSAQGCEFGKSQ